jgi:hypothetical protein
MCHNSTVEGTADQVIPLGRLPLRPTHRIKLGGRQWLFDGQRPVDSGVLPCFRDIGDHRDSHESNKSDRVPTRCFALQSAAGYGEACTPEVTGEDTLGIAGGPAGSPARRGASAGP